MSAAAKDVTVKMPDAAPIVRAPTPTVLYILTGLVVVMTALVMTTLVVVVDTNDKTSKEKVAVDSYRENTLLQGGTNVCKGKKPYHSDAAGTNNYFKNTECVVNNVIQVLEQAGMNVTKGYIGGLDATGRVPVTSRYWEQGMCAVNVHWHYGAEHLSEGEYDATGTGPGAAYSGRKLMAGSVREGFKCHKYDAKQEMHTKEYDWKHCVGMHVGKTYEVHWPNSAAGQCGTPNQYQTPFYDGVFCTDGIITLSPLNTYQKIGVEGQVFTIVNDENYYYPDLIRGMIVDGDKGDDVAVYTGSTTGTSRDNTICSKYTPITWQVDRKCHMISASSFDKMCADMKAQRDDMTDDLHAHGARELVSNQFAANNLQDDKFGSTFTYVGK